MRALVVTDRRYFRTPEGRVWTPTTLPYNFWGRYLAVFEEVRVLARIRKVTVVPAGGLPVEGKGVSIEALPDFEGPLQYLRDYFRVRAAVRHALNPGDAVILRVPSQVAGGLSARLFAAGYPFALEVIGDPFDAFSPGASKHPLRGFFRHCFKRTLVRQCQQACAVAYVTAEALQRRYPPREGAYTTHYSSVELPQEVFALSPRVVKSANGPMRLITVGNLSHMYKATDVLIDAVGSCARQGLEAKLTIVGDGKHRSELEALARKQGLERSVTFLGQIPSGEAVRQHLDRANLFVLPSRQEGLPRALLEAMARGLPCVASDIGGTAEVLHQEDLVPPGDRAALAKKIAEVLASPERMDLMARRNLDRVREYRSEVLSERRTAFYSEVKRRTEESNSRRVLD